MADIINKNAGNAYADSSLKLILMLDIKTEAVTTINKLIDLLMKYPAVTRCPSLTILVTGSKPPNTTYNSYPSFLWFDGLLSTNYNKEVLSRIAILDESPG